MQFTPFESKNQFRVIAVVLVFLLLAPTVVAGVAHTTTQSPSITGNASEAPAKNITFVTVQGKELKTALSVSKHDQARIVAFNEKGEAVWTHTKYCRYYDLDPLRGSRILFSVNIGCLNTPNTSAESLVIVMNWRTEAVIHRFPVPLDVHDVDYLGGASYAVADKKNNRVYVYNRTRDEITWQYRFKKHFPPYPKAGGKQSGYTHVNDIDAVNNGSAFLVSPRNFDRVMLINRSTKEVVWTLGEEDNYSILSEQHDPDIISQDPVTVLVADSENNRVVEYRRTDDGWVLDWGYKGQLRWPRDADRLPNGNTLIVDSGGNRVLEVTPRGKIVWEVSVPFAPYDTERPALGDEAGGPTMRELGYTVGVVKNESDTSQTMLSAAIGRVSTEFMSVYFLTQWVFPSWIGHLEFAALLLIPVVLVGWVGAELFTSRRVRSVAGSLTSSVSPYEPLFAVGGYSLLGIALFVAGVRPGGFTTVLFGLGILAFLEASYAFDGAGTLGFGDRTERVIEAARSVLLLVAVVGTITLFVFGIQSAGHPAAMSLGVGLLLVISIVRQFTT